MNVKHALTGLGLGAGSAAGAVPTYGLIETQLRESRGLGAEVYPLNTAAAWVVPVIVGGVVGLAIFMSPKWVGSLLGGTLAGAAVESLRRRTL